MPRESRCLIDCAEAADGDRKRQTLSDALQQAAETDGRPGKGDADPSASGQVPPSPGPTGNEKQMAAVPADFGVLLHQPLGAPPVAHLLGSKQPNVRLMNVVHNHSRFVGDTESKALGNEPEFGVSYAPIVFIKSHGGKDFSAHREVPRVAFSGFSGLSAPEVGCVARLDHPVDRGFSGGAREALDDIRASFYSA